MITPDGPGPTPSRHPSFPDRPGVQFRRRVPAITCITCAVTYLDPDPLSAEAPPGTWVCPHCLHPEDGARFNAVVPDGSALGPRRMGQPVPADGADAPPARG